MENYIMPQENFVPQDNTAPQVEPVTPPANDNPPAQAAPDQGVNRNPIVDPSAFIINDNYSSTN